MLPRSFLVLGVTLIVAFATNGQINPYFVCDPQPPFTDSYHLILNRRDEIVLNNCSTSVVNEIIDLLQLSLLHGRHLCLNMATVNLTGTYLTNVTEFDLSDTNLSEIDLRAMIHLERLNLTSNKFRSLDTLQLANVTLTTIDLSRNRLGKLQGSAIPTTRRLYLRSNNIMELESTLILPNSLVVLDLTRNEIENITLISFTSPTLRTLNLSINLINAISNTTFSSLTALQTLILECNKIFDIELGTFASNGKLVELNLRDNNLSMLKKGVFDTLANLQILDVSKNRLLRLTPDNIQNLNNLVHFSLSENTKLCQNQCKHDLQFLLMLGGRLKVLKMNRLRLRYFPVTLTTSIRMLDLSGNKLTSIQTGDLENFPFLEVLDLSANQVQTAEGDVFSRMEYLQQLHLQDNRLERVPSLLPPSLRILHLHGNQISHISSTDFHNLSNLNTLTLNSNSITRIESDAFASLNNLKYFDISHNPILHLRTDAFEGANKLETLHAAYLRDVSINVTDLRYFPISELPNLRYLNLSHSPEMATSFLTDFPLLTTVKQLEILDLDNVGLAHLPTQLQRFFAHLKLLSLLDNPINCSDNSFREWKESYRLETHYTIDNNTGLRIRISRHLTQPYSDRVTIRSRCSFNSNYTIISKDSFWASVQPRPIKSTSAMCKSTRANKRKLSLRSLSEDEKAKNRITTWQNSTPAISSSATQQTIIRSTFYDFRTRAVITASRPPPTLNTIRNFTTKLPTEATSAQLPTFFLNAAAPLVWNNTRSDERSSFFDWFPSLNESTSDQVRVAALDDSGLEHTHPGVVIFLFISGFILIAFGSLIALPCIRTYKWRWHRYHMSQLDNECQPSIEISSISAFIGSEVILD